MSNHANVRSILNGVTDTEQINQLFAGSIGTMNSEASFAVKK